MSFCASSCGSMPTMTGGGAATKKNTKAFQGKGGGKGGKKTSTPKRPSTKSIKGSKK